MKKIKINVDREILPTSEILKKQDFNKLVRYVMSTSENTITPWQLNPKGCIRLNSSQILILDLYCEQFKNQKLEKN